MEFFSFDFTGPWNKLNIHNSYRNVCLIKVYLDFFYTQIDGVIIFFIVYHNYVCAWNSYLNQCVVVMELLVMCDYITLSFARTLVNETLSLEIFLAENVSN